MSYLSMPTDKPKHNRSDFIAWVDRYLRADPSQPYQYRGIDVYAARCGLLHAFTAEADLHRKDPSIYQFIYNDGGQHALAEDQVPKVAMIGTASFFNDLAHAVLDFLDAAERDLQLRSLVESRLPLVYKTVPINQLGISRLP